jgi:hypothetical protein
MNAQQAPQHLPEKSNSPDSEVAACLLTTKQAGQYLCLEPQTLEVWRGRGKGPTRGISKSLDRLKSPRAEKLLSRPAGPSPGGEAPRCRHLAYPTSICSPECSDEHLPNFARTACQTTQETEEVGAARPMGHPGSATCR